MFLFVGLTNGVLMRIGVDAVSGQLASDFRTRFLGAKPVRLFKVLVQGQPAVLALSSRSWLCYNYQGRYHITPMSYETLEYAATFASEQCPEGFVSVASNTLRILTVERFGEIFNQQTTKLAYTPRKAVRLLVFSLPCLLDLALVSTSCINYDDAKIQISIVPWICRPC